NRRACEGLGYTRDELVGRGLSHLEAGGAPTDLSSTTTQTVDTTYRRKDGTTFPVEVRFGSLAVGGERLTLALVRDISQRRGAEAAVRERDELLQSVITHIPCGVFWKDRRSVYLGCNDQVARDTGAESPDRLLGRTDLDVYRSRTEAEFYRQCDQQVMTSGVP